MEGEIFRCLVKLNDVVLCQYGSGTWFGHIWRSQNSLTPLKTTMTILDQIPQPLTGIDNTVMIARAFSEHILRKEFGKH